MRIAASLLIIIAAATGCSDAGESGGARKSARAKPLVLTTFYPVRWMTERIAGDLVDVECPVPAEADPIFWKPSEADIAAFQAADLIVRNGAKFEKWMERASLPESRVVDTAYPLFDQFLLYETKSTHSHGAKGEHSHSGLDGHTWVDPVNAKTQAGEILTALVKLLPGKEKELRERHRALTGVLDGFDERLRELSKAAADVTFFASHPAYNYMAKRYGLEIQNLDLDPEEVPSEETMKEIRNLLEKHPSKVILWESEPKPEVAAKIGELGLESFVFSPCELLSAEDIAGGTTYETVMEANLAALAEAL